MTQMVTRCPKCATAFRITSTQLESAKGAVRCGSCLHIFKAQEYLVKGAEEEKAAAPKPIKPEQAKPAQPNVAAPKPQASASEQSKPEAPVAKKPVVAVATAKPITQLSVTANIAATKPAPTASAIKPEKVVEIKPVIDKAKVLEDEDDVLISDDMDAVEKPSTYEFDGFIDLDMHPKQTVSLFEREIRYEPPIEDDDEEATDESWAEELLDDDGEPLHQFKKPVAQPAPVVQATLESPREPEPVKDHPNGEAEPGNKYSGPVFSLVSENTSTPESNNDTHETREEPFFSEAFLSATRAPEPATESTNFAAALFEQEPESEGDEAEKSSKRPVKSASKMRAFDTSRASLLMNIMPAPVEFTARRMRRWYQKKLWPSLAIIMCIMFFFQIAYFKFDYFSRVEPYRTAYLFICPILRCEVPSLVDTSQILATNLIVRNHPDIPSALMVDAILINNAPFEQPFPDLILSFSKLDETPVATRRFTPKEYLGGELAGMKYIPQRQPVHITLEISDPGPDAVNYTLATH